LKRHYFWLVIVILISIGIFACFGNPWAQTGNLQNHSPLIPGLGLKSELDLVVSADYKQQILFIYKLITRLLLKTAQTLFPTPTINYNQVDYPLLLSSLMAIMRFAYFYLSSRNGSENDRIHVISRA
jgi:hypothetical protein